MTADSKRRLDEAKQRYRQARDLPKFRQLISTRTTLGHEFEVRDISESAPIADRVHTKVRQLRTRGALSVAQNLDEAEFLRQSATVLQSDGSTLLFVFLARWSQVGAMVLSARKLAENLQALLEFDGDTVTACTPDLDRIYSFDLLVDADGTTRFEVDQWRV